MGVKKGDIIDERKHHPESCGLVIKVMGGGQGFEKVLCCHELTEADMVAEVGSSLGRKRGTLPPAVILDEKKLYPDSCGLRVMIMDGGAGFKEIRCCGHSLSMSSIRDLQYGGMRGTEPGEVGHSGQT